MWAFHITHHSSRRYNFTVAVRLNLFILPLHFVFMLPLAILGFSPELIIAVNSLTTLYQLWVHTELIGNLGFLDRIFNTPSNHRVHHGKNPHYLDRNYGAIFIFWDRLFGTYEPEVEAPVYGLTHNVDSHNPFTLTFHEVQAMWRDVAQPGSLRQRLRYIFGSPGWQPDVAPSIRPKLISNFPLLQIKNPYLPTKATAAEWAASRLRHGYYWLYRSSFIVANMFIRFNLLKNNATEPKDSLQFTGRTKVKSRLSVDGD